MSGFKTNGPINLLPNTNKGIWYTYTVATLNSDGITSNNDGAIPYGTTVSSVIVVVYDSDDSDVTSDIIVGTPTLDSNIVKVQLKYPVTNGAGSYRINFVATISNDDVIEDNFNLLVAKLK